MSLKNYFKNYKIEKLKQIFSCLNIFRAWGKSYKNERLDDFFDNEHEKMLDFQEKDNKFNKKEILPLISQKWLEFKKEVIEQTNLENDIENLLTIRVLENIDKGALKLKFEKLKKKLDTKISLYLISIGSLIWAGIFLYPFISFLSVIIFTALIGEIVRRICKDFSLDEKIGLKLEQLSTPTEKTPQLWLSNFKEEQKLRAENYLITKHLSGSLGLFLISLLIYHYNTIALIEFRALNFIFTAASVLVCFALQIKWLNSAQKHLTIKTKTQYMIKNWDWPLNSDGKSFDISYEFINKLATNGLGTQEINEFNAQVEKHYGNIEKIKETEIFKIAEKKETLCIPSKEEGNRAEANDFFIVKTNEIMDKKEDKNGNKGLALEVNKINLNYPKTFKPKYLYHK